MFKHEQEIVDKLKELRDAQVQEYAGAMYKDLLCDDNKKIIDDAILLIENLDNELDAIKGVNEDMKSQMQDLYEDMDSMREELMKKNIF